MELLGVVVLALLVLGVGLYLREKRTGRGRIIDERPVDAPQSEADRDAMRAADAFRGDRDTSLHQ